MRPFYTYLSPAERDTLGEQWQSPGEADVQLISEEDEVMIVQRELLQQFSAYDSRWIDVAHGDDKKWHTELDIASTVHMLRVMCFEGAQLVDWPLKELISAFVGLQSYNEHEKAWHVSLALDAQIQELQKAASGTAGPSEDVNNENHQTNSGDQVLASVANVDIEDRKSESSDAIYQDEVSESKHLEKEAHLASCEQLIATPALQMHIKFTEAHYIHKAKPAADESHHAGDANFEDGRLKSIQPKATWPAALDDVVAVLYEAGKTDMDLAGDLDLTMLQTGGKYYQNAGQQQREPFEDKFPSFLKRMRAQQILSLPGNTVDRRLESGDGSDGVTDADWGFGLVNQRSTVNPGNTADPRSESDDHQEW